MTQGFLAIMKGEACRDTTIPRAPKIRLGNWCISPVASHTASQILYTYPKDVIAIYSMDLDNAIKLAVYTGRVHDERRDNMRLVGIKPTVFCTGEFVDVGNDISVCDTGRTVSIATDDATYTLFYTEYVHPNKRGSDKQTVERVIIPG